MIATNSLYHIGRRARQFCELESMQAASSLLKTETHKLQLLAAQPQYYFFSIRKKNGKLRQIEDPVRPLKKVQRALNDFLQPVYYLNKSDASYGFIMSPKKDAAPRNIITNARCHLGNPFLLNVDLEDFFHQVSEDEVTQLFQQKPFQFNSELAALLAALTTHQQRLPMGAPTSPVLSNFAAHAMDEELLRWARAEEICYTRYVDDLSFSSVKRITDMQMTAIKDILYAHRFALNPDKIKWFGPEEEKLITGIKLGKHDVELPASYIDKVNKEIDRFQHFMQVRKQIGDHRTDSNTEQYQQQLAGHINFAATVLGEKHNTVVQLTKALEIASDPPFDFESEFWRMLPYEI